MKNERAYKRCLRLLTLVMTALLLLTACDALGLGGSISLEKEEYHAEYGERFYIPQPVLKGIRASDVSFEVKDADGNVVTKAALGSFYPELGTYTLTFTNGKKSASARIVCADTKGPEIAYIDYIRTVFEGETITVPTFAADDVSGVQENSAAFRIYKGLEGEVEVTPDENNLIIAEQGAKAYRFVYTVSDIHANVNTLVLITEVKADFVDESIADDYIWDFDEPEHITLIGAHTSAQVAAPDFSMVTDGVDGINGGALKLSASGDGIYAGVKIFHGKPVNTGNISRIILRVYADSDITILSIKALREDLANIEFADLAGGKWYDLEINPRALYPDATELDSLEISFRNTGNTNLYIDGIYSVPFYTDESLQDNVLGDFDEEGYLANIEQSGFDIGKGLISAEYEIISKEDLPEGALRDGATGGVLKVTANEVWSEDYGGYGVLGDGFKYYLAEPLNTADINQLFIRFYCAGGDGLALSFFYEDPMTKELRSKARWVRGVEGEWVTISVSQEMITQIVPMYPTFDKNDEPIVHFDLKAIILTSCGNVPGEYTPCTEFYVDEISYIGNFTDEKLDSENGVLGDFDESGYIANLDQAWLGETNTAVYTVIPAGSANVPAGANGGVVKVNAYQASNVLYPNQGAQGDGIRFYLFEQMPFDDIESVTIRALGAAGKGTAINVGFVIERKGVRMISNAWWQQVKPGEWTDITLNRARLTVADKDDKTGEMIPRIQDGDILIGIRIWACAVQTGLEPATEFYIDEISCETKVYASTTTPPSNTEPLAEDTLIDFTHVGDERRVSQSALMWPGQTNGGAAYAIVDRANEGNARIYEYQWFNTDAKKNAFREFAGSVLEVYSRINKMDGAKVTFDAAYSMEGKAALNIEFFSNATNGGYVFYIEDSKGTSYAWRIQTDQYSAYAWKRLSLDTATLQTAGLVDIKAVSFTYACGNNNDSYLYVKPITFTPSAQ